MSNFKEIWKPIPIYTKYEASTYERIRNVYTEYVLNPNFDG